jgi:hypothetical protein
MHEVLQGLPEQLRKGCGRPHALGVFNLPMEKKFKMVAVTQITDSIGYTPIRDEIYSDYLSRIGPYGFTLYYFYVREARKSKKKYVRLGLRVIAEQTLMSKTTVVRLNLVLETAGLIKILKGDYKMKDANSYLVFAPVSEKNGFRTTMRAIDETLGGVSANGT